MCLLFGFSGVRCPFGLPYAIDTPSQLYTWNVLRGILIIAAVLALFVAHRPQGAHYISGLPDSNNLVELNI